MDDWKVIIHLRNTELEPELGDKYVVNEITKDFRKKIMRIYLKPEYLAYPKIEDVMK